MGKNKNHFTALSSIDPDQISNDDELEERDNIDSDGEQDEERDEEQDELESKIIEYHSFLKEQMRSLEKEIQSNINLSKNIIKLFLSILDHSYDLINEITLLMKREDVEDRSQKIFDLEQKTNPIYKWMDKYRDTICSDDGLKRMNRLDFLNEVDIYYNMFICTGCPRYILCALEYSPWEMLNRVDLVFFKTGRKNEMKRYQTYLSILCVKRRKNPNLLSDRDIRCLYKICTKNKEMENEYNNLFG